MHRQAVHQAGQFRVAEKGRRAATPVQLGHAAAAIEVASEQFEFLLQRHQVTFGDLGVAGDDLVAGAVITDVAQYGMCTYNDSGPMTGGRSSRYSSYSRDPKPSVNCSAVG
jgi:hypothetical protein